MLTTAPLSKEETETLDSLFKFSRFACLVPASIALLLGGFAFFSSCNLLLTFSISLIPIIWSIASAGNWLYVIWDLQKGEKCIREGIISDKKIKQSYNRLTHTGYSKYLVRLDNDANYFNLGSASRYPEYMYSVGKKLRIEYVPNTNHIFSVNLIP